MGIFSKIASGIGKKLDTPVPPIDKVFRKSYKSKERKAKQKELTAKYTKAVQAHVQEGKDLKARREKFGSATNEATFKVGFPDKKVAAEGHKTLDKSFSNRAKLAKLRVKKSAEQPGGHKAPRPLDLWDSTKGSSLKKKVLIKVAKDEGIYAKSPLPKNTKRTKAEPRPAKPDVVPSGLEGLQNNEKRLSTQPYNFSVKNPSNTDLYKEVPNYPAMTKISREITAHNQATKLKREAGDAWKNLKSATSEQLSAAHAPKVKRPARKETKPPSNASDRFLKSLTDSGQTVYTGGITRTADAINRGIKPSLTEHKPTNKYKKKKKK